MTIACYCIQLLKKYGRQQSEIPWMLVIVSNAHNAVTAANRVMTTFTSLQRSLIPAEANLVFPVQSSCSCMWMDIFKGKLGPYQEVLKRKNQNCEHRGCYCRSLNQIHQYMSSSEDTNDTRFEFWFDCCKFHTLSSSEEVWASTVDIVGDVHRSTVSTKALVQISKNRQFIVNLVKEYPSYHN